MTSVVLRLSLNYYIFLSPQNDPFFEQLINWQPQFQSNKDVQILPGGLTALYV